MVDVHHAARQILLRVDRRGVVTVFPERPASPRALVEALPGAASDQLQPGRNLIPAAIEHQQVHVVAGHLVVEDAKSKTLPRLVQPAHPRAPIPRELQQELSAMAARRQVPDLAGDSMAVRTRHRRPSSGLIVAHKCALDTGTTVAREFL